MARLSLKKNNPVKMVGDGKKPNRFWVTASTDFEYQHDEGKEGVMLDWAEDLMKKHGIESHGFPKDEAVFDNFEEARKYAEELMPYDGLEPAKDQINNVTIEDRLNGQVWNCVIVAHAGEWGWKFRTETFNDWERWQKGAKDGHR
jgi:hypothetical protein